MMVSKQWKRLRGKDGILADKRHQRKVLIEPLEPRLLLSVDPQLLSSFEQEPSPSLDPIAPSIVRTDLEVAPNIYVANDQVGGDSGLAELNLVEEIALLADPLVNIPTDLSGRRGDTVIAPLNIDNAAELLAAHISLSYDNTALAVPAVQTGSITNGWTLIPNVNAAAGTIQIGLATITPAPAGAGSIVEVDFQPVEAPDARRGPFPKFSSNICLRAWSGHSNICPQGVSRSERNPARGGASQP